MFSLEVTKMPTTRGLHSAQSCMRDANPCWIVDSCCSCKNILSWMFSPAFRLLQLFNNVVLQVPEGPSKQCHAPTSISLTGCIMIHICSQQYHQHSQINNGIVQDNACHVFVHGLIL